MLNLFCCAFDLLGNTSAPAPIGFQLGHEWKLEVGPMGTFTHWNCYQVQHAGILAKTSFTRTFMHSWMSHLHTHGRQPLIGHLSHAAKNISEAVLGLIDIATRSTSPISLETCGMKSKSTLWQCKFAKYAEYCDKLIAPTNKTMLNANLYTLWIASLSFLFVQCQCFPREEYNYAYIWALNNQRSIFCDWTKQNMA